VLLATLNKISIYSYLVHTNNHKGTLTTKLGNNKDLDMRKTRNKKTFREQTLKKGGQ
jgi:hypothetical protein